MRYTYLWLLAAGVVYGCAQAPPGRSFAGCERLSREDQNVSTRPGGLLSDFAPAS